MNAARLPSGDTTDGGSVRRSLLSQRAPATSHVHRLPPALNEIDLRSVLNSNWLNGRRYAVYVERAAVDSAAAIFV